MSKKKKIIIGSSVAGVIVIGIIVTLLMVFNKEDAYRVIKVLELDGTAVVERENIGELQAYTGMALQNGDQISVQSNSMVILQMDDDKYAYVEENSVLTMVAEGTSRDSKTIIQLERGAITCHVDGKLNNSSSYEVHTQNSVMAVRGTVFRVAMMNAQTMSNSSQINLNSNITNYSNVVRTTVYDGEVLVTLRHSNGTLGEARTIVAGQSAAVGDNSTDSFFLSEAELNNLQRPEEHRQALKALQTIQQRGVQLSVTTEELNNQIAELDAKESYNVYFYAYGQLFGVQEVKAGQVPQQPDLLPGETGAWNIDFAKPIVGPTEVYWVE